MTEKEFLNAIAGAREDVLQLFLDALSRGGVDYCVIGGLAVNAYAEPVVSLDLDIIVAAGELEGICAAAESHFRIERFTHSVNLRTAKSDLRIQLRTDHRHQDFLPRASAHTVLGYPMRVASIEDALQGKIWAYLDEERRKSKRQKDLADIARLVEAYPSLVEQVPETIRKHLE
jgi:hypothetical protein